MEERAMSFRDGSIFDGPGAGFLFTIAAGVVIILMFAWVGHSITMLEIMFAITLPSSALEISRLRRRLDAHEAQLAALKSGQVSPGIGA